MASCLHLLSKRGSSASATMGLTTFLGGIQVSSGHCHLTIGEHERAMSVLCLWLTSHIEVKKEELTQIWKGLLYCLWHAKEPAVHAFLTSLRNEWGDTDNNGLDRCQLLLKHHVSQMFAFLKKSAWRVDMVMRFMDALAKQALLVQDGIGHPHNSFTVGVPPLLVASSTVWELEQSGLEASEARKWPGGIRVARRFQRPGNG